MQGHAKPRRATCDKFAGHMCAVREHRLEADEIPSITLELEDDAEDVNKTVIAKAAKDAKTKTDVQAWRVASLASTGGDDLVAAHLRSRRTRDRRRRL